jgi:hypothetical protein
VTISEQMLRGAHGEPQSANGVAATGTAVVSQAWLDCWMDLTCVNPPLPEGESVAECVTAVFAAWVDRNETPLVEVAAARRVAKIFVASSLARGSKPGEREARKQSIAIEQVAWWLLREKAVNADGRLREVAQKAVIANRLAIPRSVTT